jgi:hypothetical protein
MPSFSYRAFTSDLSEVEGFIEGSSDDHAVTKLRGANDFALSVGKKSEISPAGRQALAESRRCLFALVLRKLLKHSFIGFGVLLLIGFWYWPTFISVVMPVALGTVAFINGAYIFQALNIALLEIGRGRASAILFIVLVPTLLLALYLTPVYCSYQRWQHESRQGLGHEAQVLGDSVRPTFIAFLRVLGESLPREKSHQEVSDDLEQILEGGTGGFGILSTWVFGKLCGLLGWPIAGYLELGVWFVVFCVLVIRGVKFFFPYRLRM